MDVRNIREEVPNIKETEVLQQMYILGLEQLNGYRQIESTTRISLRYK